jgi:hypothetical protein
MESMEGSPMNGGGWRLIYGSRLKVAVDVVGPGGFFQWPHIGKTIIFGV